MLASLRTKADFFQLYLYSVGFQLLLTLFLLVKEFVVIHNPHDGGYGIGCYLHQIKAQFLGPFLES